MNMITPATEYLEFVIPAKAGIQADTGCRSKIPCSAGIKSGMTELASLIAGLIIIMSILFILSKICSTII